MQKLFNHATEFCLADCEVGSKHARVRAAPVSAPKFVEQALLDPFVANIFDFFLYKRQIDPNRRRGILGATRQIEGKSLIS